MKTCLKCEEVKPLTQFLKSTNFKTGLTSSCKDCINAARSLARQASKDRGDGKYTRSKKTKVKDRLHLLKYTYGLTLEDYDEMYETQKGRCAGCGTRQEDLTKRLNVDHDHDCCPGKKSCGSCVRGLLCNRCNWGIGQFGDDPNLLHKMAQYVTSGYVAG